MYTARLLYTNKWIAYARRIIIYILTGWRTRAQKCPDPTRSRVFGSSSIFSDRRWRVPRCRNNTKNIRRARVYVFAHTSRISHEILRALWIRQFNFLDRAPGLGVCRWTVPGGSARDNNKGDVLYTWKKTTTSRRFRSFVHLWSSLALSLSILSFTKKGKKIPSPRSRHVLKENPARVYNTI